MPGIKHRNIAVLLVVFIAIVLLALAAGYLVKYPATPEKLEPITIGAPPVEQSALIIIAADQGFFEENGLNVTVKSYTTALDAINGMESGNADLAESSEYPLVTEAFKKENISIIGTIDKYQTVYIVGRKDRGIANVSDLKGKKIGLHRGGITEFYLGRFLDLQGIGAQNVTIVDLKPMQYASALANGSVDTLELGRKDMGPVEKSIPGNDLVLWPSQSDQAAYDVITCRNDWASGHPEQIKMFLKSLAMAENYAINHPAEAKAIVQKNLNFTDAYMATVWPDNQYSLTLDQSLVLAMEDEGRWMMVNNMTNDKKLPDFRKYVNETGIMIVKPESVNIIG